MKILSKNLKTEQAETFRNFMKKLIIEFSDSVTSIDLQEDKVIFPKDILSQMVAYQKEIKDILSESPEVNGRINEVAEAVLAQVNLRIQEKVKKRELPTIDELETISEGLSYLNPLGLKLAKVHRRMNGADLNSDISDAEAFGAYMKGIISNADIYFSEEEKSEFSEKYEYFLTQAQYYAQKNGPDIEDYISFKDLVDEVNAHIEAGDFTPDQFKHWLDAFGREFMESFIGKTILRTTKTEEGSGAIGANMGGDDRMKDIYKEMTEKEISNKWNALFRSSFEASHAVYNRSIEIAGSAIQTMSLLAENGRTFSEKDPFKILDAPVGDGTVSSLVLKEGIQNGVITKESFVKIFMRDINQRGMELAADRLREEWRQYGFESKKLIIDMGGQNGTSQKTDLFADNKMGDEVVDISYTPGLFDYVSLGEESKIVHMVNQGVESLEEKGIYKSGQFKLGHPTSKILNTFGWPLYLRDFETIKSILEDLDLFQDSQIKELPLGKGEQFHVGIEKEGEWYEVVLSSTPYAEDTQWLISVTKGIAYEDTKPINIEDRLRKGMQ